MVPAVLASTLHGAYQPYAIHRFHIHSGFNLAQKSKPVPRLNPGDIAHISLDGRTLTLTICNTTQQSMEYMEAGSPITFLQAKQNSEWKSIERHPFPTCANATSYVTLKPGDGDSITTSLFPGSYKTEIRLAMYLTDGNYTYSQPIPAAINELAFTFKNIYKGLGTP